jgi:hypothetical protein
MTEQFDPYYKWLGIPPKDQPPNHYRLLGIEAFESDRDVIEAAANRLMSYLHEIAAGDEVDYSQQILNEVSAARVCLLDRRQKSVYDVGLKKKQKSAAANTPRPAAAPAAKPPVSPQAPPLQTPAAPPQQNQQQPVANPHDSTGNLAAPAIQTQVEPTRQPAAKGRGRASRKGKPDDNTKQQRMVMILGGAGAVALIAAAIAIFVFTSSSDPVTSVVIDVPEEMRNKVSVLIDGKKYPLPEEGEVALAVKSGEHALVMQRRGYQRIDYLFKVGEGKSHSYKPDWEPLAQISNNRPFPKPVNPPFPKPINAPIVNPNNKPPNNSLPNNSLPNNKLPNNKLPNNKLPNNSLPNNSLPNNSLPNNSLPNNSLPNNKPTVTPPRPVPTIPVNMVLPTDFETPLVNLQFREGGNNFGSIGKVAVLPPNGLVEGRVGKGVSLRKGHIVSLDTPLMRDGREVTISFWAKMDAVPTGDEYLADFGETQLFLRNRRIGFRFPDGTTRMVGTSVANIVGTWTNIHFDYSAETGVYRLYIDGQKRGQNILATTSKLNLARLTIGRFAGSLDEVYVYGRLLSDEERATLTNPDS